MPCTNVSTSARLIGENIEYVTRPASDLGAVEADRGQIEQVLMNLVVNARDAMPEGGSMVIETFNATLDEAYAGSRAEGVASEYVMISVSDTGMGMSDEVKAHVFEPFFTTKEKGKGTGLGLATCYGIIEQMGGHINIYSEVGVGTTVKFYVPRATEEALAAPAPEKTSELPRGSETILVVEDEDQVREIATRIIERQGYTVICAADAENGLRLLEEHEGRLDLLLTDVVLPGMGGRKLAERVREAWPEMKVLFMSGYSNDVILQHKLFEHDVTLLHKPFTMVSLARKLREELDAPAARAS